MIRTENLALMAAAAAIGLSMTPADAARLIEPIGYAEMPQLVEAHPELDQAIFPGLSAAPLLMGGKRYIAPPGFAQWGSAVSNVGWVVPEGVYLISVVCIGGGGGGGGHAGTTSWGGRGGGGGTLSYSNDIPVAPGETLTVTCGNGGNGGAAGTLGGAAQPGGISQIRRGSNVLISAEGGGRGEHSSGTHRPNGGNAGINIADVKFHGASGEASTSSFSTSRGGSSATYTANGSGYSTGVGLNGIGSAGSYGIGGAGRQPSSSGSGLAGSPGGVRIIWGKGKNYPSNTSIP